MNNEAVVALSGLAILLIIFLLARELWCWYWKINEIVKLQKETNKLLKELIAKDSGRRSSPVSGPKVNNFEFEKIMD